MDTALTTSEIARYQTTATTVQAPAEDDLAFFQALWFWIPAALALWSALIWGVTRLV